MTRAICLAAVMCLACGCAGTSKPELRPGAETNDVALSNLNLAVEYLRRGEYEKALEKLDRAREADPKYPLIYNTYGVLYERLGDFERAERNFEKALQLNR
ncbi:MAG: tetratricopeptide repeat protein, partial [Gammaproteobacteria bacterium]